MATKLIKCPECGEKITELNAFSEVCETFYLTKKKEPEYQGLDYCEGHNCYCCPECGEQLAKTELEAIKILKGV